MSRRSSDRAARRKGRGTGRQPASRPPARKGWPTAALLTVAGALALVAIAWAVARSGPTPPAPAAPTSTPEPTPAPGSEPEAPPAPRPLPEEVASPPAERPRPAPLFAEATAPRLGRTERVRVARVVDGDTLTLTDGRKVRLIGINTPERDRPLYREAGQALRDLVDGEEVTLEYDELATDRYRRGLAYVHKGDLFVNGEIVRRGMAYAFLWPQNRAHGERLIAYQHEARDKGVGLWALERPAAAPQYIGNASAPYFHREGCARLAQMRARDRRVFKTRADAFDAGMNPCVDCGS